MKILFIVSTNHTRHNAIINNLLQFFSGLEHDLFLFTHKESKNCHLTIPGEIQEIESPDEIQIDIVLAFSRKSLELTKKNKLFGNTPKVYLFCNSDFDTEYDDCWADWERLIIINDNFKADSTIYPKELTFFLDLPVHTPSFLNDPIDKIKNIHIEFDDFTTSSSVLLKIIPAINSLNHLKFLISGKRITFPPIFNNNVKLTNENKIEKADLVIGNGSVIEKAIANSKPSIVVGSRGFGGFVTKTNFENQLKTNFQGRLGGEIGEYIPEKILIDEILDVIDMDLEKLNTIISGNKNLLLENWKIVTAQLDQLITDTTRQYNQINENLPSLKLLLSNLFVLIPSNEKQFMLQKTKTRQLHSILEEEEYQIVKEFSQSKQVNKALFICKYNDESESFLQFINELLNEKILIIDE